MIHTAKFCNNFQAVKMRAQESFSEDSSTSLEAPHETPSVIVSLKLGFQQKVFLILDERLISDIKTKGIRIVFKQSNNGSTIALNHYISLNTGSIAMTSFIIEDLQIYRDQHYDMLFVRHIVEFVENGIEDREEIIGKVPKVVFLAQYSFNTLKKRAM